MLSPLRQAWATLALEPEVDLNFIWLLLNFKYFKFISAQASISDYCQDLVTSPLAAFSLIEGVNNFKEKTGYPILVLTLQPLTYTTQLNYSLTEQKKAVYCYSTKYVAFSAFLSIYYYTEVYICPSLAHLCISLISIGNSVLGFYQLLCFLNHLTPKSSHTLRRNS